MDHHKSDKACSLCRLGTLSFDPRSIYCYLCGASVKRNAIYHTVSSGEKRPCLCRPCYSSILTETVEIDGLSYFKERLEQKKNDGNTDEPWLQCDTCNEWNHQVCALVEGSQNELEEAEYTCARCCMSQIEKGERKPLKSSEALGAQNLPRTALSDHLEQRLAWKLKQERTERARASGKSINEVPGAEPLVVRVVSSIDRNLQVKPRFMEIFQENHYPSDFPYRLKVILLFQMIEGVPVILFAMFVQEFGAECHQPNNRRIYLSFLDSVRYFSPDIVTIHGESLRTYVYHEILIGYLDYSKRRGFSSCYIWACPPQKGEEYIFHCPPNNQKKLKSAKLREWYWKMFGKAIRDGVVVEVTNLYDHFFVPTRECKADEKAVNLPYFDGDYWPAAAESVIERLQQEDKEKIRTPRTIPNIRASILAMETNVASSTSMDRRLMHKVGKYILPMKEDCIMVHMHYVCTHCRLFITSGYRWTCRKCKTFQLCESCFEAEGDREDEDRHPVNSIEVHLLINILVEDILPDTKTEDECVESEFFATKQAFLNLCRGNHYQYDTLRRAKYSSTMVLCHLLENHTASATERNKGTERTEPWKERMTTATAALL